MSPSVGCRIVPSHGPRIGSDSDLHRYTEAVDILYGSNVFRFHHIKTLDYFPTLIPAPRFASIRSLEFIWQYDNLVWSPLDKLKTAYDCLWARFAAMRTLRTLRVSIELTEETLPSAALDATWLAPLQELGFLHTFVLVLAHPYFLAFKRLAETLPFQHVNNYPAPTQYPICRLGT